MLEQIITIIFLVLALGLFVFMVCCVVVENRLINAYYRKKIESLDQKK